MGISRDCGIILQSVPVLYLFTAELYLGMFWYNVIDKILINLKHTIKSSRLMIVWIVHISSLDRMVLSAGILAQLICNWHDRSYSLKFLSEELYIMRITRHAVVCNSFKFTWKNIILLHILYIYILHIQYTFVYWQYKCIAWKSLWIKASAKCINVNVNILHSMAEDNG